MITILLVHGATDDRAMYADYLHAHGFRVVETGTTDSALLHLTTCRVVITGLLVPGSFDAIELLARIHQFNPSLPIIVVTACSDTNKRAAAEAAGCAQFFLKPCFPEDLLQSVLQVLDMARPVCLEQQPQDPPPIAFR